MLINTIFLEDSFLIKRQSRVAVDGNITTSRGVGTAIAFAAALIEQLESKEKAEEIKKSIIYGHFS